MRISIEEKENLVNTITGLRPKSEIYLFGSRADDNKKGGDIDILVIDETPLTLDDLVEITDAFWIKFGEQKLDILHFRPEENVPFKCLVLPNAIRLNS